MSDKLTAVTVAETGEGSYTQTVENGRHTLTADEPLDMGGLDKGPSPFEFVLAGLGACTTMTLRMYADRKGWPLEKVSVKLTHHKEDDMGNTVVDIITRDITLTGALDAEQRQRLLEIANKCPVHKMLENNPKLQTRLDG
jgi:putative redox protein